MKKKITIGAALAGVLLAVLLTFQITYSFVGKVYQAKVDTLTKTPAEFTLLTEADRFIRENYQGAFDDNKIENGLIKGYVSALDDPYAAYLTAEEYAKYQREQSNVGNGIGVRLTYNAKTDEVIVYSVFSDSPAQRAGLQKGDVLNTIGNEKVSVLGFYGTLKALSAEEGSELSLTAKRSIAEQVLDMSFQLKIEQVTANCIQYEILPDSIGYVQIFSFDESGTEEFMQAVDALASSQVKAVVFDVRNTTGGNAETAAKMLDRLLPEGTLFKKKTGDGKTVSVESDATQWKLPMAVLINRDTAFAGEIFAVALRDFGAASLVGETSYGKSIGQNAMELSNGSALILSNISYLPPSSDSFEDVGLKPDVTSVLKTDNLYLIDRKDDNQLQAAISSLRNE